eukprot:CAMPEP_0179122454 /NCGR_PEP_ID=MMETSP0796-20121207/57794_1 /TAXON_ID=73915 /ORGANISM="Pyrodinium bahamense, Strain pbaha01" /LENGTH=65 /DNA_ID=CAMNT_0020821077 /DNA_START=69 /DNA_END=264 /DNA_ORIENTATION=-
MIGGGTSNASARGRPAPCVMGHLGHSSDMRASVYSKLRSASSSVAWPRQLPHGIPGWFCSSEWPP